MGTVDWVGLKARPLIPFIKIERRVRTVLDDRRLHKTTGPGIIDGKVIGEDRAGDVVVQNTAGHMVANIIFNQVVATLIVLNSISLRRTRALVVIKEIVSKCAVRA